MTQPYRALTVVSLVAICLLILAAAWRWWSLTDKLVVVDNGGAPVINALSYLTAIRTGGAAACNVYKGSTNDVGNALAGSSQLIARAPRHGLHFDGAVNSWTNGRGDSHQASLPALIPVKVSVWRLSSISRPMAKDIANAASTFAALHNGMSLSFHAPHVSSTDFDEADCSSAEDLARAGLFHRDAINVYYAADCPGGCHDKGISCRDNRQFNFVYGRGELTTLVHELGHALIGTPGISHWPKSDGPNNIMRDDEPRSTATTGQVVTMNFEQSGALARLKLTQGPLDCAKDCPPLDFGFDSSSCPPPKAYLPQPVDVRSVPAWFSCSECTDGEMDAVLRDAREDTHAFAELVDGLRILEADDPLLLPVSPEHRENFVANRQIRALIAVEALALRPHPAAVAAIDRVLELPRDRFRRDVAATIDRMAARRR